MVKMEKRKKSCSWKNVCSKGECDMSNLKCKWKGCVITRKLKKKLSLD